MTRLIDADALKAKLQKHHDIFVNAYDDFKDMPFEERARVDEITSCIAEVVNAPTVEYPFTHVTVKHPVFDNKEFDGWIDKQRCLLFVYPMTFEGAKALGWKWEADNDN